MRRGLLASAIVVSFGFAGLTAQGDAARTAPPSVGRAPLQSATPVYYPPPGDQWQRKQAADVGMDGELLDKAIAFAAAHETKRPRDFSDQVETFGALLGPLPALRGGTNGLVIRHGYIVAEFGDTHRAEPTYSVAKSFLSTILGLTVDRGMKIGRAHV